MIHAKTYFLNIGLLHVLLCTYQYYNMHRSGSYFLRFPTMNSSVKLIKVRLHTIYDSCVMILDLSRLRVYFNVEVIAVCTTKHFVG